MSFLSNFLKSIGLAALGEAAKKIFQAGPQIGVTVWQPPHVTHDPDWIEDFKQISPDFVSVKVLDGHFAYMPQEVEPFIRELRDNGFVVHLWGYHYCRTKDEAQREADAVVRMCQKYGITEYHWNAEHQWDKESTDPAIGALAFTQRVKAQLSNVRLWCNAVGKNVSKVVLAGFDYWEPQIYGPTTGHLEQQFVTRGQRFGAYKPVSVMIATGRPHDENVVKDQNGKKRILTLADETLRQKVKKDRNGEVYFWGRWRDDKFGLGYLSLIRRHKPAAVNFFRAPLNFEGNSVNPPLHVQVADIRKAWTEV